MVPEVPIRMSLGMQILLSKLLVIINSAVLLCNESLLMRKGKYFKL